MISGESCLKKRHLLLYLHNLFWWQNSFIFGHSQQCLDRDFLSNHDHIHNSWMFIPAPFFDRFFFLWSFWSSSTLPRLVCLAYVRGFYFLFCCVEVSSVMLCCVCCVALRCVVLCCGPLCCVALCCNPLCCVALRCVAIRCVASVLLRCVVLRSVMLSVLSRCVALCCDPL